MIIIRIESVIFFYKIKATVIRFARKDVNEKVCHFQIESVIIIRIESVILFYKIKTTVICANLYREKYH